MTILHISGARNQRGRSQSARSLSSDRAMLPEAQPEEGHQTNGYTNGHNNSTSAQDASRPQAYPLLHEEQMRQMMLTQQETVAALCNLNSAQEETARTLAGLNEALRELSANNSNFGNQEQMEFQRRRLSDTMMANNAWRVSTPMLGLPKRQSIISELDESRESRASAKSDGGDDELELDRKQVRLDGLEVYAVVSAVTAGTLVAVFDSYNPGDITDLFMEGRYLECLMSIVFVATGTVGIMCGLHCIFVFSLVTMYGRTALGMERDDALEVFFADTGLQRIHGFRTFVGSLYSLMIQLVILITSKVSSNPWFLVASLGMTSKLMYYVYADTQLIMEKAMVIFASPTLAGRRNSLRSAGSTMNMFEGLSDDSDDDSSSGSTTHKSASVEKKRATTVNKKTKGSAMTMAATEFETGSVSSSIKMPSKALGNLQVPKTLKANKSIRWSFADDEDGEENDKGNTDMNTAGTPHFISNALNKVGLRSRRNLASNSMEDQDSGSETKASLRDKRTSLTKLSKREIMKGVQEQT